MSKPKALTVRADYIPAEPTIALGKTGHSAVVKTERLSDEVIHHIFMYGLKQILNDAAASGQSVDEKVGLFNKKLEALYAGALRASRETDPLSVEIRRVATLEVRKRTTLKPSSDEFKAAVAKAAGVPALRVLAEQNLARAKALDFDIDLG